MSYYRIIGVIERLSITPATGVKSRNYRIIEPASDYTRTKSITVVGADRSYNPIISLCNCSESIIESRFYNPIISIISEVTLSNNQSVTTGGNYAI
jgi:hypothetical protein